jgi:glycosyltransferase involved in cell wall biosynthesis
VTAADLTKQFTVQTSAPNAASPAFGVNVMSKSLKDPSVSIIIPTSNSGETIEECLRSIRGQSYQSYEVIIVDNFSNDNTLKIATEFGAKITQEKCNPAQARNIGTANSTGKYAFFLDSDQVLSPPVIQNCVRKCENGKVGMVRIPEIFVGKSFWSSCLALWKNYYERVEQSYEASEKVIRGEPRFFLREHISRAGLMDGTLLWGENYDLYQRLRKMGVEEALCESSLYHYELGSLRKIVSKNLQYGRSMPIFMKQTKKQIIPILVKQALLTFREVLRSLKPPKMILGCTILLLFRTYSAVIGLSMGWAFRD